jgi:hypothetical protein
MAPRRPTPGPSRRPPLADVFTFRVRVDLVDAVPPIWRIVEVPSSLTLETLHPILQTAMGWTDSHLHGFCLGDPQVDWPVERYLTAFDFEEGDVGVAEADVRPRTGQDTPAALLDGGRACPPEDCGGPYGYRALLDLAGRAAGGQPLASEDAEWLSLTFGSTSPADVLADAELLDAASIDADLRAGRVGGVAAADLSDSLAAALGRSTQRCPRPSLTSSSGATRASARHSCT